VRQRIFPMGLPSYIASPTPTGHVFGCGVCDTQSKVGPGRGEGVYVNSRLHHVSVSGNPPAPRER
jgi:hypothetical protein